MAIHQDPLRARDLLEGHRLKGPLQKLLSEHGERPEEVAGAGLRQRGQRQRRHGGQDALLHHVGHLAGAGARVEGGYVICRVGRYTSDAYGWDVVGIW